jgi:hypothetical protein
MNETAESKPTSLTLTTQSALRALLDEHGAAVDGDHLVIESLSAVLLIEDIELRLGVRVPARLMTSAAVSSWTALCGLVAQCQQGPK